jgi:hypothetical protein
MKTPFYPTSILFLTLSLLLLLGPISVSGQKASSELSLSFVSVLPSSAQMTALPGFSFQLDYKFMNKHFGMGLALNYMANSLDSEALLKKYNASSVSEKKWLSFTVMTKFVGRANFLKNKLLVDFSFSFGAMITDYPSQMYSYSEIFDNQLYYISAHDQTTFAVGGGARINYIISDFVGVFVGYDIISGNQKFELVSTSFYPKTTVIRELTNFRVTYSLINVGVTIFIGNSQG